MEVDGVAEAVLKAKNLLECSLCSSLSSEVPRYSLPCGHIFCATCTDRSLYQANECPACKAFARPKDATRTYCMDALIQAYCHFIDAAPTLQSRVSAIEGQREKERAATSVIEKVVSTSSDGAGGSQGGIQSSPVKENALNSLPELQAKQPTNGNGDTSAGVESDRNAKRRVPDTYSSQHLDEGRTKKRMVADTYDGREHDHFYLDSYEGSQRSFEYSDGTSAVEPPITRDAWPAADGNKEKDGDLGKEKKRKPVAFVPDTYRIDSETVGKDEDIEDSADDDEEDVRMAAAEGRRLEVKGAQADSVAEERMKTDELIAAAEAAPDGEALREQGLIETEPLEVSPDRQVGRPVSQSSAVSAHSIVSSASGAGSTEKAFQNIHHLQDLIEKGLGVANSGTEENTTSHRAREASLSLSAPQLALAVAHTPAPAPAPFAVWGSFDSDAMEELALGGLLRSAKEAGAITLVGDDRDGDNAGSLEPNPSRRTAFLCHSEMAEGARRVQLTLPCLLAIAHGDDILDTDWLGKAKSSGKVAIDSLTRSLEAYRVQVVRWRGVDHRLTSPSHARHQRGIFHGLVFSITGEDADGVVTRGDVAGIIYANGGALHVAREEAGGTMTMSMTMTMTVDGYGGSDAASSCPSKAGRSKQSAGDSAWKRAELCLDDRDAARREGVLDLTWLFLSLFRRSAEPLYY